MELNRTHVETMHNIFHNGILNHHPLPLPSPPPLFLSSVAIFTLLFIHSVLAFSNFFVRHAFFSSSFFAFRYYWKLLRSLSVYLPLLSASISFLMFSTINHIHSSRLVSIHCLLWNCSSSSFWSLSPFIFTLLCMIPHYANVNTRKKKWEKKKERKRQNNAYK